MKKFRIISIFILIGLLASCSKGTSSETGNTTPDTMTTDMETSALQQEEITDSLPDNLDFEGVTMRIGCRNQEFSLLELTAEQTGDIVADAVYNRNLHVDETVFESEMILYNLFIFLNRSSNYDKQRMVQASEIWDDDSLGALFPAGR